VLLWLLRIAIWGLALVILLPCSIWFTWGAVIIGTDLTDLRARTILTVTVGAWGIASLWWLLLMHETSSLARIGWTCLLGLILGTSLAVWVLASHYLYPDPDGIVWVAPLVGLIVLESLIVTRMLVKRRRGLRP
jgi:hypothetical protein